LFVRLNVLVASGSRSRTVGIDIAARKSMHALTPIWRHQLADLQPAS
jgi:hypothetical protein